MKGKKFYITLIGLIIIGIGSVFIYRQQQEARFLEFEGYEISDIEKQVAGLYNEDKTDLADGISKEELEELEVTLSDLQEKDLGRQNKNRIELMQEELTTAEGMLTLEDDIDEIFIEDTIVDKDISVSEVEDFEEEIATYEDKTIYHERNMSSLSDAKQQLEAMTNARDFVENLFTDEDVVREGVTREEEEEALELIDLVKNKEVKEELTAQIETVTLALNEREGLEALEDELAGDDEDESEEENEDEEDLELDEELDEESEEVVEEEPEYTAPPSTENADSSGPSNTGNSGSSSSGSSSNNESNNTGSSSGSNNTGGSSNNSGGSNNNNGSSNNNNGGSNSNSSNESEESSSDQDSGNSNHIARTYRDVVEVVIPYETVYINDPTLSAGKTYDVHENYSNGLKEIIYQVTVYQNGETERQFSDEEIIEQAVNREIIRGTRESETEN